MRLKSSLKLVIVFLFMASASTVSAQTLVTVVSLETLASFTDTNGGNPKSTLTLGTDGNFYGTTQGGGSNSIGTVFKVTTNGTLTALVSFNGTDGENPNAGLTLGGDGNFYGTTWTGSSNGGGTVFKVTTNSTLTTLVSFNSTNGAEPAAALTLGADGNFYGTTWSGGSNYLGTVFRVTTNGALTTLVSFNSTNGTEPAAALTLGADGNFYGTTCWGGDYGYGTVFKVTTSGTLTTLVSFNSTNGADPQAPLVQGTDGNFYGTTSQGGITNFSYQSGMGTVFVVTTNGTLTTLVSFNGTNGASPLAGLTLGASGNLYGTIAYGGTANPDNPSDMGTVFMVTTNGTLTILVYFNGTNGVSPMAALTLGTDGNFYGTTYKGGSSGDGTVFRLLLTQVVPPTLTLQFWSGYPLLSVYGTLGDTYTIEYTANLEVPNWTPILIVPNLSVSPFQMIDPTGIGQPARFYRAVLSQ